MLPLLKSIHFLALYLFLGGPLFWHMLWRPAHDASSSAGTETTARRVRIGLIVGFGLFVASGVAAGVYVGSYGWLDVVQVALAAGAFVAWMVQIGGDAAENGDGVDGGRLAALAWALSGGLLIVTAALSRMAETAGAFFVASHGIHLAASLVWIGGGMYLAGVPGSLKQTAAFGRMVERLSVIGFVAAALIGITGAVAAYVHVPVAEALQVTTYGRTLSAKIVLFVVLLLLNTLHYLWVGPRLRHKAAAQRAVSVGGEAAAAREPDGGGQRLGRLALASTGLQGVAAVLLLVTAGVLTSLSPRDGVDELIHRVWDLELNGHPVTVEMHAGDVPGALQIDLFAPDGEFTELVVDLDMPDHGMGVPRQEAQPIGPGHYRVEPRLSMEGDWVGVVTATWDDGRTATAEFEFSAIEAVRSLGMTRRLDPRAIFFEFQATRAERASQEDYTFQLGEFVRDFVFSLDERPMYFVSGLFWFAAAAYVLSIALRGDLPRWAAPASMAVLTLGVYFLLSSMLVNAYPTTYVKNPIPFTAASVETGKELYVANCSACHGPEGRGDGPMAPFIDPPPEDLRVRHIDAHPDGELFWWFLHGIPGSDMPSTEETMTDEERWHVVNFVRSLHREVPDADGL